jgi:DNA gyrase subunit A
MSDLAKEISPVNIEDELKQSYLDYAMSVIVGRALPDVRDGLKPVHRRVLFAMDELGNDWNKAYKKSARIVGDVIGKYHPHGDSAVYDTIVRMAQPFSLRYMLVDGQGNFGSVDGDSPAAMRYTEIRMAKIAHELLADLDKETVDYVENYDGTEMIPEVMPTKVPNLLVNGSSGIAVGMATNIPPHNMNEVLDACLAMIENPDIDIDGLMEHIQGPDFPTAASINGRAGIVQAYRTGRGRVYIRSKADIEVNEKNGRETIIIHELPYQVNKARLIEKIAELVKDKKIEGISELRDESDKDGMRVVIELKKGEVGEVILNNLYSQTQMETVFGINMVALIDGQPKLFNLKEIIEAFVDHRRVVVTRRTVFELRKAREKCHIIEGQAVALANIDPVIALIKSSASSAEAKEKLIATPWQPGMVTELLEKVGDSQATRPEGLPSEYGLREGSYYMSPEQAQAILDMRLHRLTGLEQEKLLKDFQELLDQIGELLAILADSELLMAVIKEELNEIRENYGDERRTEIHASRTDLTHEDLITEENVVLTISHEGYAKTQPLDIYQAQRRGGRGKTATSVKDEDYVSNLLVVSTHDTVMCFTNRGKVYWMRVFMIPQGGRNSRGKPLVNLLPFDEGERVTSVLPLREKDKDGFIFMATSNGTVKKVDMSAFARPRASGLIALELEEENTLIGVDITDGEDQVMLFTSEGKGIRFSEDNVRAMGRTARGVRGIKVSGEHEVISLIVTKGDGQIMSASSNGFGKRTQVEDFNLQGRGGQGVIAMQCSERNGSMVSAIPVSDGEEVMLITDRGVLVRTRIDEISVLGRNTQGVRLIRVSDGEQLVGAERIEDLDVEGEEGISEETEGSAETAQVTIESSSESQESEEE